MIGSRNEAKSGFQALHTWKGPSSGSFNSHVGTGKEALSPGTMFASQTRRRGFRQAESSGLDLNPEEHGGYPRAPIPPPEGYTLPHNEVGVSLLSYAKDNSNSCSVGRAQLCRSYSHNSKIHGGTPRSGLDEMSTVKLISSLNFSGFFHTGSLVRSDVRWVSHPSPRSTRPPAWVSGSPVVI